MPPSNSSRTNTSSETIVTTVADRRNTVIVMKLCVDRNKLDVNFEERKKEKSQEGLGFDSQLDLCDFSLSLSQAYINIVILGNL